MGKVTVMNWTTKDPITQMGVMAGTCWGAAVEDNEKNYKRGKDCIESGHGRVEEYPQIYLELDGYSARVFRELYTHIGGMPTRLQSSTRYIEYGNFDYIVPPTVEKNAIALADYEGCMRVISECYKSLEEQGIPKEDIANILPLGMKSKVIVRTNLRNLVDMSHQRMCNRAYWEFRNLFKDIKNALAEYSPEWAELTKLFMPKCEIAGFCTEKHSCGKMPRR